MSFDVAFQAIAAHFREALRAEAGIEVPAVLGSIRARGRRAAQCSAAGWMEKSTGATIPEIALNPALLAEGKETIFAAIVHELLHAADWKHGVKPARGRHSASWMQMMRKAGLEPLILDSATTRYSVTQRVIPNALFDRAAKAASLALDFEHIPRISGDSDFPRKCAYHVVCCGATAYGKAGLSLKCAVHDQPLVLKATS